MLEGHQPQNTASCIPTSSTNLSITYTMVTTIETQTTIIGVIISKSLQEVLKIRPILTKREPLKQFLIFVTNFLSHNTFKFLKI